VTDWPIFLAIRPLTRVGLRTSGFDRSQFSAPWRSTLQLLRRELEAVNARNVVLEVDIEAQQFRGDGYPRANAIQRSPVVVLSFDSNSVGAVSFPADRYATWQDNVRAIALSMEALRKVNRYGVTRNAEQYQGWKQLPGADTSSSMVAAEARRVLYEVSGRGDRNAPDAAAYKLARRRAHPDAHNGDRHLWDLVEKAGRVLGVAS
jgi:hypothetical protein